MQITTDDFYGDEPLATDSTFRTSLDPDMDQLAEEVKTAQAELRGESEELFLRQGRAISQARELLAKSGRNSTFSAWCETAGLSGTHARRIHDAYVLRDRLEREFGSTVELPTQERFYRDLVALRDPERAADVIRALVESGAELTTAAVREVISFCETATDDTPQATEIGFVYFLLTEGSEFVRVCWADDPENDLKAMQDGCPLECSISHRLVGDEALRDSFHRMFSDHHCKGEWYRNEGVVARFMCDANGGA